jgi:hypothetical protein
LGGLYFHGQGTEKNLEKAANQEHAFAQNKLDLVKEPQRIWKKALDYTEKSRCPI